MMDFFRKISLRTFYQLIILLVVLNSLFMLILSLRTEVTRQQIYEAALTPYISNTTKTLKIDKEKLDYLEKTQNRNLLFLELCSSLNFFFALVAVFFVNRDLRHLKELSNQVNKILSGDYTTRNSIQIQNEHGLLANALNKMCESLLENKEEQKKFNIALQEKEEKFRSMVENSPIGTGITTLNGNFIFVNNAFCTLLGYTREKLLTMEIKDITHLEDMPKESALLKQLVEEKIPFFRLYKRHIHKDGHSVWTLLNVTTIKGSNGKPKYFTGQLQDVTERVQDEKRMSELNASLISAINELKQTEHEEALMNKMNELLQICLTSSEAYPRISFIAKQLFPDLSGGLAIFNKSKQLMETVEQWGKEQILHDSFLPNDCLMIRSGTAITIDNPQKSIICSHYTTTPKGGLIGLPMIVHGDIIGVMNLIAPEGKTISKKQQQLAIILSNTVKTALANIRLRELLQEQHCQV